MPLLKQALAEDPAFCMAECMRGYMLMLFSSTTVLDGARDALARARACAAGATSREQQHVDALGLWLEGRLLEACARWEFILMQHPLDLAALRLHHFVTFWCGRSRQLATAPASVLEAYGADTPGRGNVLGMLCFGLEENNLYSQAEPFGRQAVESNPDDLWAIHSVAHVMEMQRRTREGLAWLDYPADAWADRNPFRGHLWWHRGLFVIEAGELDEALQLYDRSIYDTQSAFYLDIQNAAAFLARLEFAGVDVGDRWEILGEHAVANLHDHVLAFTDLNHVLTLARTRRFSEARDFLDSMRAVAESADTDLPRALRDVAIGMGESLVRFEEGDPAGALTRMIELRPRLIEVGASHAQRDLFSLYAIEAARRAGDDAALRYLTRERAQMTEAARRS